VVSVLAFIRLLQLGLQVDERRHVALGVFVDPSVVNQADGYRIEEVVLLPPRPSRDDEPCLFEDAQVLHDAEARHLQLRLELRERAAVALEEPVEQEATRRIGKCLEHPVVVVHAVHNM
jgi:hypothetical protein